jgi:hypothetical protein
MPIHKTHTRPHNKAHTIHTHTQGLVVVSDLLDEAEVDREDEVIRLDRDRRNILA